MIVGIILMAHSPGDCSSIAQCYQEKGIDCYRRLSDTNLTQPLYSEDLQSIPPGAKEMGRDALGKVVRDVLGIKLLDHMALDIDCEIRMPTSGCLQQAERSGLQMRAGSGQYRVRPTPLARSF